MRAGSITRILRRNAATSRILSLLEVIARRIPGVGIDDLLDVHVNPERVIITLPEAR